MDQKKPDKPWLFKKGQSGNPSGVSKDKLPIVVLERHSKSRFKNMLHNFAGMTLGQLKEVLNDQNRTNMELVVARLYSKCILGSPTHMNILFDRLLGPLPRNVDITSDGEKTPIAAIINNIDPDKLTDFVSSYRKRIENQAQEVLPALEETK